MAEAIVDEEGRIVVPDKVTTELHLRPDQRLKVSTRGNEIVLVAQAHEEKAIEAEVAIAEPTSEPEDLKSLWGAGIHRY